MRSTRRELLEAAALAAAAYAIRPEPAPAVSTGNRPRGLIFNSDPDALLAPMAATPAGYIGARFAAIAGTQVASIADCTGQTTIFEHRAARGERMDMFAYGTRRDDVRAAAVEANATARAWRDNMRALAARGTDILELGGAFARRHGLEHLWAYRVNDVHDSFQPFSLSLWKRTHPKLMLGRPGATTDVNDPRYWWSALDFERREVRSRLLWIIGGTARRYRLDGLDLDYYRAPLLFRPHMELEPASGRQRALLTGWQSQVRDLCRRVGRTRNRSFLLCARVPATIERCRHVGIEIESWLERGLVDMLRVGGGYMPFTEPVDELIRLAHRHGVPVHVTLSGSGLRDRLGTPEAWRGAASNQWHAGCAGLYLFNFFPDEFPVPRSRLLHELGSPATLAFRDKRFAIESEPILQGLTRNAIVQDQILPVRVPGSCVLPVGDDLPAAARRKRLLSAELRVTLSDPAAAAGLTLRVNGHDARAVTVEAGGTVLVTPPPAVWRQGRNRLAFGHGAAGGGLTATRVELDVRYRSAT